LSKRQKLINGVEQLDEIREIFGLNESELGDLFGVRWPSVVRWRESGIPVGRRATVERVLDLARVLHSELIASRIPEIVRTKDDWLQGRSILQTIQHEGPGAVYPYLNRLFSHHG